MLCRRSVVCSKNLMMETVYKVVRSQGIFLDDLGNIAEGPTMNVAILTKDGEFVVS